MPVAFFGSTGYWRLCLVGTLLLGKVRVAMSRVGLKLEVWVKSWSIVDLPTSALLAVPHHHNRIFQPSGRLYLFLVSSKHSLGAWYPYFLQWEHKIGSLFPCDSPLPHVFLRRDISLSRFLISLNNLFCITTKFSLVAASLELLTTSCLSTDF